MIAVRGGCRVALSNLCRDLSGKKGSEKVSVEGVIQSPAKPIAWWSEIAGAAIRRSMPGKSKPPFQFSLSGFRIKRRGVF